MKTAGSATNVKRRAENSSGGKCCRAGVDDDEVHAPDDGDEDCEGGVAGGHVSAV
jgi:hypothetical protein